MNYDDLCLNIFEQFPNVRYAAVHNVSSECLAGGMRQGMSSHLTDEQHRKRILNTVLTWRSHKDISDFIGHTKFLIESTAKVTLFTFSLSNNDILLLSSDSKEIDLLVNGIFDLLKAVTVSN